MRKTLRNHITEPFLAVPHRLWGEGHAARMGPAGLALYLALAHYADGREGVAWPSLATLAEVTGMSRRSVIEHLKRLRRLGYVEVVERREGRGVVYAVTLPRGGAKSAPVQNLHGGGAKSAPVPVQNLHPKKNQEKKNHKEDTPPLPPPIRNGSSPPRGGGEGGWLNTSPSPSPNDPEVQAEIIRRTTERERLRRRRENAEAHRVIARALLDHGGKELLADFVELTRRGPLHEWERWLRLAVLPHLHRLGAATFANAVRDGLRVASAPGIKYPASRLLAHLEGVKPVEAAPVSRPTASIEEILFGEAS